jgi:hypothetical protein
MELAPILAVVLALLSYSRIRAHGDSSAVEDQTAGAIRGASRDETALVGVQTAGGDPFGSSSQTTSETSTGTQRPPSRTSAGTRGSSKDGPSGGSVSEDTISQDYESAGSPVYYLDQADDAYGGETSWAHQTPPDPTVNQKAFDILRVDWAPVSHGYSTSITVAGTASEDGSYVSYGYFFPRGEACRIYYLLTPGLTAYAHAFCESSGDAWGFVGVVEGSEVTSTPTTAGGTQIAATFDSRGVPPLLETAGRKLHNLSAFTCEEIDDRYAGDSRHGLYCGQYGVLDTASSALTYRV